MNAVMLSRVTRLPEPESHTPMPAAFFSALGASGQSAVNFIKGLMLVTDPAGFQSYTELKTAVAADPARKANLDAVLTDLAAQGDG